MIKFTPSSPSRKVYISSSSSSTFSLHSYSAHEIHKSQSELENSGSCLSKFFFVFCSILASSLVYIINNDQHHHHHRRQDSHNNDDDNTPFDKVYSLSWAVYFICFVPCLDLTKMSTHRQDLGGQRWWQQQAIQIERANNLLVCRDGCELNERKTGRGDQAKNLPIQSIAA